MLFVSRASSLEVANKPVPPGSQHGFLWRLRDKHNRVGLFEVNPGHELHRMTRMMQEGLWAATQVFMDNPPKVIDQSISCNTNSKRDTRPAIRDTVVLGIRETYQREGGRDVCQEAEILGWDAGKPGRYEGLPASRGGCVL